MGRFQFTVILGFILMLLMPVQTGAAEDMVSGKLGFNKDWALEAESSNTESSNTSLLRLTIVGQAGCSHVSLYEKLSKYYEFTGKEPWVQVFDSQNKAVLEDMGQHQYMKLDVKKGELRWSLGDAYELKSGYRYVLTIPVRINAYGISYLMEWGEYPPDESIEGEFVEVESAKQEDMVREVGFPVEESRGSQLAYEENGHSYTYTYGSLYGKLDATQEIPVKVIWSDYENAYGYRPKEAEVFLVWNGKRIRSIQVSSHFLWKGTFNNVPAIDELGQAIETKIEMDVPAGYEQETNTSQIITNKLNPKLNQNVEYRMARQSKSGEDQVVELCADGKKLYDVILSEKNNWNWTYTELERYDAEGREIIYSDRDYIAVEPETLQAKEIDAHKEEQQGTTQSGESIAVQKISVSQKGIQWIAVFVTSLYTLTNAISHIAKKRKE